MKQTKNIFIYLIFSSIAVALVVFLVQEAPPDPPVIPIIEKIGIAGVFITCCIFGISFTLRPNWVHRHLTKKKSNGETNAVNEVKRAFRGHHPDCPAFQNHTIRWKERVLCAGCLGLFVGLCLSIVFMMLYLVIDIQLPKMMSYLIFFAGLFILFWVFLENLFIQKHLSSHAFSNSMLPVSFFIITISVVGVTGKFIYGFFMILLCSLWIDTRIQLSKWRHGLLCAHCTNPCKMYPFPC